MRDPARLPRVLFAIGSLDYGGSESQLVSLIERAHGRRIDAALLALRSASDQRLSSRIEQLGVPYVVAARASARARGLVASVLPTVRAVRRLRPDLAYPWLEEPTLLLAPIAAVHHIPVVIARRNISGGYDQRPRPVVAAIHAAERLSILATANSAAVAVETIRRGVPAECVRVVPNGHAFPEDAVLPEALSGAVTLGYLARMRPEKGHLRFIRALSGLRTEVAWRVHLGGDGPMLAAIKRAVGDLGLEERVRFFGAVSDVAEFWRRCDIAALCSDHEGSPNALIEAAGMGRPVVATAVGGIPEFVDAEVGFLVDPGDDAGLTSAIRRLIEDRALRRRLGAAARRCVRERFSIEAMVDGHCAAIDEALTAAAR